MANSLGFPIDSFGYAGTIAPNDVWANVQAILGARYAVNDIGDARVTPIASGTREVKIAAGSLGGHGILDKITSDITLQLPTVASGTTWFLIVARRTWGVTQATSINYISAGSSAAIPARSTTPGTVDDQPLALVPLTAGNTVPGTPIDLRVVGTGKGGAMIAFSELTLSYFNAPGSVVRIGTDVWTRTISSSYVASWSKDPGPSGKVPLTVVSGPDLFVSTAGWTGGGQFVTGWRLGNVVTFTVRARRTGATIDGGTYGNFSDAAGTVGVLTADFRPQFTYSLAVPYSGDPNPAKTTGLGGYMGGGYVLPNGNLVIANGAPGIPLNKNTGTQSSVEFTATYLVAG